MIRSLRQRHCRICIALGLFLPAALVLGIAVRKPVPLMITVPVALQDIPAPTAVTLWNRPGLFPKSPVQTRLLRPVPNDARVAIDFSAANNFIQPDLLVYGVPGNPAITDTLPANAMLLGRFNAPALPVPESLAQNNAVLILYSLANNEIVDVSQSIEFNSAAK